MPFPIHRLAGGLTIALLSISLLGCGGATPSVATSVGPATEATPSPASIAPEATPTETAEATTEATPGPSLATTGRVEVVDKGFAITLPAGWTRVDLTQGDLDAILEGAGVVNPELAEQYAVQIQSLLATGLAVFAIGPDPSAGTQLTVLAIPGGGLSLDLLEQINSAQVEALAEGDVETERLTLPAGDAIHYRYSIGVEGTPGATLDQYLLVAGSNQLVVTVTNGTEADAKAIADSIEVLD